MAGFHRKSHMFWVHVSVHNKQEGLLPDLDSKTTIATTDNIDFLQSRASVNSFRLGLANWYIYNESFGVSTKLAIATFPT